MKQRMLTLLAVLVLVLALVPAVSAQDGSNCLGLSAEDCSLLEKATVNAFQTTSLFSELDIAITVSGIDSLGMLLGETGLPGDINIGIQSSGPLFFIGDGRPPQTQQTVTYNATIGTDSEVGTLVASIVDNIFYLQNNDRVQGVDLTEELADSDATAAVNMNATNLAEMFDLDASQLSLSTTATTLPPELMGFFTFERMGDDFVLNMDINGLLASPEFAEVLGLVGALAGDELGGLNPEDLAMLLPMLVEALDSTLVVTQTVDSSVPIATGNNVNFHLSFDLGVLAGSPGAFPPIVVDMVLDWQFSQFNEVFELSTPDNVEMVEPDELDLGIEMPSF
jgi:hypothetical protein